MSNPNYHGIALNNARVIKDFSKSLQKRNKEVEFLIGIIHKLEVYEQVENVLNSNEVLKFGRIEERYKKSDSATKKS